MRTVVGTVLILFIGFTFAAGLGTLVEVFSHFQVSPRRRPEFDSGQFVVRLFGLTCFLVGGVLLFGLRSKEARAKAFPSLWGRPE